MNKNRAQGGTATSCTPKIMALPRWGGKIM